MLEFKPFTGLAGVIVVIALIGALASLGLSNTDLANFNTTAAKARAIDQITQQNAQKGQIDLDVYKEIEVAKAQAAKNKIQLDLEVYKNQVELNIEKYQTQQEQELKKQQLLNDAQVEFERLIHYSIPVIICLVILFVCSGMIILAVQYMRTKALLMNTKNVAEHSIKTLDDRWHRDPAWVRKQVTIARQREINSRKIDHNNDINHTNIQDDLFNNSKIVNILPNTNFN